MTDQTKNERKCRWWYVGLPILVLLALSLGLFAAWSIYTKPYRKQREAMEHLTKMGAICETEPSGPGWMARLLGADSFRNIISVTAIQQDHDSLHYVHVDDSFWSHLNSLTALRRLNLGGTDIGDSALAHLHRMPELEYVDLNYTRVTDAGLIHLKGLTNLRALNLNHTEVTDDGLAHLKALGKLNDLARSWDK